MNRGFEEMTGYTRDEAVGNTPWVLQGEKPDQAVLDRLSDDLAGGRPFHGETVNYRKDGSEFMIEWKVVAIRSPQGDVEHYLAVQHDVTSLRG